MKNLIGLLAVMCISNAAAAVVTIEPYVGYEMGTSKATAVSTNTDTSGKTTGVMFGARVGLKSFTGLWLAADYSSDAGAKFKADSGSTDSDVTHTALGVTVGFDSMFGIRLYGGYNFSDQYKLTTSGTDFKFDGGYSYKAGIGYRMSSLPIALNIEYMAIKPKKYETGGVSSELDSVYSKWDTSSLNFIVSVPFDFL